jgi:DNA replicative helicase MCM subunit Mcm2 (Cdc46/Mcm family)
MKTIIDQSLLKNLRNEMNIALADVATRHGVTLRAGTASYDPVAGTANFKLEVVALGEDGAQRDMPAELFLQNAEFIGLKAEHLGKIVTIQGRTFTVAGYKPKARKNCIVIKDTDSGKSFVTSADVVKRQLSKA